MVHRPQSALLERRHRRTQYQGDRLDCLSLEHVDPLNLYDFEFRDLYRISSECETER